MDRIESHRLFFSQLVTASVGIADREHPVAKALAITPREHFLGRGPWDVFTATGYIQTPTDDPAFVYQDVAIALARDKQLNNGQPALHAACLASLAVKPGETIVHVGAGTGYYTALLSRLTGSHGRVFGYEIDSELAERAVRCLAESTNVIIYAASGSEASLPDCDVIYVNAGATGPIHQWLNALQPGGRLLFPLTPAEINDRPVPGMMLMITNDADNPAFRARFVCPAAFTSCVGARDNETAANLTAAFSRGDARKVRSLRIGTPPDSSCWVEGHGWWLSAEAIA